MTPRNGKGPGKGKRPGAGKAAGKPPGTRRRIAEALSGAVAPAAEREMLGVELRRLRSLFAEIAQRHAASVEARIAALVEAVERGAVPQEQVPPLLRKVRALSVKPRKGRRKDLARIERLVESSESALGE